MKRTTIYLEPDLEVALKQEAARSGRPMAGVNREALQAYLSGREVALPPGVGGFRSGHDDTAERTEELLAEEGFGEDG